MQQKIEEFSSKLRTTIGPARSADSHRTQAPQHAKEDSQRATEDSQHGTLDRRVKTINRWSARRAHSDR